MFLNIITCVGITIILTQSSLFERLRDWVSSFSDKLGELVNCAMCMGVWVGFIMSFIFSCNLLHLSFCTSVFAWSLSAVINLLINISYYYDKIIGDEIE